MNGVEATKRYQLLVEDSHESLSEEAMTLQFQNLLVEARKEIEGAGRRAIRSQQREEGLSAEKRKRWNLPK